MAKHNIFKNKRGASIEIGKIRPNTYNEYCGCTVDIQIFVYNRTMNRRCKFWLVDYDTSWSGDDLLNGLYESELENNENFDWEMELSDVYSEEEMEEYVWDAIKSEWEFYPDDCPFIDCINPIEDALKTMAEQVFKDCGDVIDPEIDAFLVSPTYCWGELEEKDLIDYDAMPTDNDVSIEDFEKEYKISKADSEKSMDEAIERAIAYCKEHDTRCLALPYAICKAMCDTSFVLPRAMLLRLSPTLQTTNWESENAAAAGLLQLRSDLLEALKKSRWVDVNNRHYARYEDCDDIIYNRNKTLQKLITLLESMCNVRSHDVNHNYVYGPDVSANIRQLKEEYNVVMPHKILYDFLVDKELKEEYSKQIFHNESDYGDDEDYDRSRLAFIRDDVFAEIDKRMKEGCLKDVFDADILLKEYEGETLVQQILDSESDDDFYEESEDGFIISHGIRYYCTDYEYTYIKEGCIAENPGFLYVEPNNEREYKGKVCIPSHVTLHGMSYPVSEISSGAFEYCEKVTEIIIGEGVSRIACGFNDCQSLRSITIPTSVTEMPEDCFADCDGLREINVAKDNSRYCVVDKTLYEVLENGEKRELYHLKKPDNKIIKRGIIARRYKYTISDDQVMTIKGEGELENNDQPLKFTTEHVVIADGITSIGSMAFWWHSNMQTIHIPDSVTRIEDCAFGRCYSLQAPTLPDSIVEIGRGAFDECYGFTKIVLPCNLKVLPLGTFSSCKNLQEIELSNVERIEEDAFAGCKSLKRVVIPPTVKYIGSKAFRGCESLEEVIFSDNNVRKIEDSIFEGCQELKRVVLPSSYAYRNLGNLWGRDYTSLVHDIVEFLPSDKEFPMKAIETFYNEHVDNNKECIDELSQTEKSLKLNESTTIWGFATLTKVYEYPNNYNARYTIRFEEFEQTFEDGWFEDRSLKAFLRKQFLSKPVDRFDGLKNNYTRYLYKWNERIPDLRYGKPIPVFVRACQLLGKDLMTPYYSLDENHKIVRLEEPTEIVDASDAFEGFSRLVDKEEGMIGAVVGKMMDEFGAIKTCRALGQLIATGNITYHEFTISGETHGTWTYHCSSFMTGS